MQVFHNHPDKKVLCCVRLLRGSFPKQSLLSGLNRLNGLNCLNRLHLPVSMQEQNLLSIKNRNYKNISCESLTTVYYKKSCVQ